MSDSSLIVKDLFTETGGTLPADRTLTSLAGAVERFVDLWEQADEGPIPDLATCLPPSGDDRRLALIELVKVDLEYRWRNNRDPLPLSDYVQRFPQLAQPTVPADLIYEELHQRRQAGLVIDPQEYLEHYPAHASQLRAWLGLHGDQEGQEYQSTRLIGTVARDSQESIQVGERIDEFDLLLELGQGGFARVFLARQASMQRLIAVKISADRGDEPKTLAGLDHDYIVRVFSVLRLPDRGLRLLLMQYVPGGTLQAVVDRVEKCPAPKRTGRLLLDAVDAALEARGDVRATDSPVRRTLEGLPWPEVVAWLGARLALALDAAHRNGVLHRDVKPANVLLTADAVPKLADFNISFSEQVEGAIPAAHFGGTLPYMSPEQLEACSRSHLRRPDELDGRSDLYSLGLLLWELLTGIRPLTATVVEGGWQPNLLRQLQRRREGLTRIDLWTLPPNCPLSLTRVLKRCLEPDPARRWPSGKVLAQQLELCLDRRARTLTDPPVDSWTMAARRPMVWILAAAVLVPNALAAVANYQYNRWRIVEHLQDAVGTFDRIQAVINGIAFPLGLGIGAWLALRVRRALFRDPALPYSDQQALRDRVESLRLGERCTAVCLVLWLVAGLAYPLSLHLATASVPASIYAHFFSSLFISGLIATSYPYLIITWFCVHVVYPAMIAAGQFDSHDREELDRLDHYSSAAVLVAASVPLLAVIGMSFIPSDRAGEALLSAGDVWLLRFVCLGSFAGLGLAWKLSQSLRTDIAALLRIMGGN